jgi:hypothetical protein
MDNMSICGLDCSVCDCFELKFCPGCHAVKGKVFHCPEGQECAIYNCCVTKHGFSSCIECPEIPCGIWRATRDPKYTDEEFEQVIAERIANLCKKI